MNTLKLLAFTLVLAGGVPPAAQAAAASSPGFAPEREGWFAGVGLGTLTLEDSEGLSDALNYGFLVGGWRPNPYFSVEARAGTSFSSLFDVESGYEFDWFTQEVKFRAPTILAAYARAIWPVTDRLDLYAQAGYSYVTIKASLDDGFGTVSASDSQSSLSYGVGASWLMGETFSLDFEYQPALVDGDIWKMQSLNMSLRMRF